MIEVTDNLGRKHYLAPASIASVYEAAASSQWHDGIRSYVKTFDGATIKCRDEARAIASRCWEAQANDQRQQRET